MIEKRILIADRVRRPPREGFSWIDRHFLRDFASELTPEGVKRTEEVDPGIDHPRLRCDLTKMERGGMDGVVAARDDLLTHDLVAYQPPLTQVLSLPVGRLQRKELHGLRALSSRPDQAKENRH